MTKRVSDRWFNARLKERRRVESGEDEHFGTGCAAQGDDEKGRTDSQELDCEKCKSASFSGCVESKFIRHDNFAVQYDMHRRIAHSVATGSMW